MLSLSYRSKVLLDTHDIAAASTQASTRQGGPWAKVNLPLLALTFASEKRPKVRPASLKIGSPDPGLTSYSTLR